VTLANELYWLDWLTGQNCTALGNPHVEIEMINLFNQVWHLG
jgi:hypothetical protein